MTITISAEDQRSIRAIEITAGAGQWLKCHTRDGRKAYGVPSQSKPLTYYLVTQTSCTCPDAQRHPALACKHQLAVRLHVELVKAQQAGPAAHRRHVAAVPPAGAIFRRFESD